MPVFGKSKGDGQRGAHCRAHNRASIGIDSRSDIDGYHWSRTALTQIYRQPREPFDTGVETGAEDRVDDDSRSWRKGLAQALLAIDRLNRPARALELRARPRAVALERIDAAQQQRAGTYPGLLQAARRHHPVAAIVALARHDQHPASKRRRRPPLNNFVGDRLTGPGHQVEGWDAIFLLAQQIDLAAFRCAKKLHIYDFGPLTSAHE